MPLCIDCKHCQHDPAASYPEHMCMNPMAADMVDGKPTHCSTQRYADPTYMPVIQHCGPSGAWFEPKTLIPTNIYTTGITP